MNNTLTPRTDSAIIKERSGCLATFQASRCVSVAFARTLERELVVMTSQRDEAIESNKNNVANYELQLAETNKELEASNEGADKWAILAAKREYERDQWRQYAKELLDLFYNTKAISETMKKFNELNK